MKSVTKRELNQQTAQVLADVVKDGAVIVTERGVPPWRIDVVTGSNDAVDLLFLKVASPEPPRSLRNGARLTAADPLPMWTRCSRNCAATGDALVRRHVGGPARSAALG